MNDYDFTLKFSVSEDTRIADTESCLFEQGCDDALVGLGQKGRLGLRFTRAAANANQRRPLAESLREVAKVTMQLNVYRESRRFKDCRPAIEDALFE